MQGRQNGADGDVFALLAELRSLPMRPLPPEEIPGRRSLLEEAAAMLGVVTRTLRTDGERLAHQHLTAIVEQETRRVEETANLPYTTADHVARLATTWLSRHPGEALDVRPCLTLAIGDSWEWSVRIALAPFTVSCVNARPDTPLPLCRLIVSPNWFASFLPVTYPGTVAGIARAIPAQALIDAFDEEAVAMALALWSDDPHSDLFQPAELVEAVLALGR